MAVVAKKKMPAKMMFVFKVKMKYVKNAAPQTTRNKPMPALYSGLAAPAAASVPNSDG